MNIKRTKFDVSFRYSRLMVLAFLLAFSATVSFPQNPDDLQNASNLLRTGKYTEAETVLRQHLNKFPQSTSASVLLGVSLDQQDRFSEAEKIYREILVKKPKEVSALANLGVLLAKTKRGEEAIKLLEEVLLLAPGHQQASYNLAALYSAKKEYRKAIPLLERMLGISTPGSRPTSEDSALMLSLVSAYAGEGKKKEAIAIADLLQEKNPDDPRLNFTLGLVFADSEHFEYAKLMFEKVNSKVPNRFEVLYNLGLADYNLGLLDKSREILKRALELNPTSSEVFYRLGLIASAKNESENALGLWLKALELNPNHHEAAFLLGEELSRNQAYTNAVQFYAKAAALKPDNLLYQIRLGVNYVRLRQYGDARAVFDREQKTHKGDSNLIYLQGYLARAEGDYDRAIKLFEQALVGMPDNADILANLGFLAYQKGEDVKAERLLRKTISVDPKNLSAHYDLGRLLMRGKKIDEAIPILEEGAKFSTNDPGIYYQLFLAYSRTKQKEKADLALAEFKRLEQLSRPKSGMEIMNSQNGDSRNEPLK